MIFVFSVFFWFSSGLLVYHLFGYPALLGLLVLLLKPRTQREPITPKVTVIIPSHNEAGVIGEKLLSVLNSRYPPQHIEVICADDGSTDNTLEQIRLINDPRLILDHQAERSGKLATMNRAAQRASGEFLIFSDANAVWKMDTLSNLMSNFAEPRVGCVSGRKILVGKDTLAEENENLYWRYESWIKSQESMLGSTVTASGELLAVRRAIYQFPNRQIINDDSTIVIDTIEQGYRVFFDPDAVTMEPGATSMAEEYGRKSRIAAGRWQLAARVLRLAPRHPGFVIKFISHKLLRLLVMPLMLLAFFSNLALVIANPPAESGLEALFRLSFPWGQIFLAGHIIVYLLAALGAVLEYFRIRVKPISLIFFFVSAQFALFSGLVRFSTGRQSVLWRKVER